MRLPPSEVERFYAIWLALISFVNQQRHVVPERLGVDPSEPWDAQDVAKIRDVLWADDALREAFIAQNPAGLSAEGLAIVASWQHHRAGAFYVLRHLKKYSVFLSAEGSDVYGVLRLVSDLEDVVPFVPCYVNAVLLPWDGQIIYDSLLAPYNITFGPGTRGAHHVGEAVLLPEPALAAAAEHAVRRPQQRRSRQQPVPGRPRRLRRQRRQVRRCHRGPAAVRRRPVLFAQRPGRQRQAGPFPVADVPDLDHRRHQQHAAGRREARPPRLLRLDGPVPGVSGKPNGDGAIYNGDYPRNFIRIGGPGNGTTATFPLGQGPNDTSGTYHCRFGSYHPGVCQFVAADGHVLTLSNSIDMNTLGLLCTISDGQVVQTP
jgi:hypothetical protein